MMTHSFVNDKTSSFEFFITEECNGCGLCRNIAPEFFDYVEYSYTYFLTHQPKTEREANVLRDIADHCPVDALREVGAPEN